MDSTESPVHGQQEGSAYNGHFESVCYHPLLLFNSQRPSSVRAMCTALRTGMAPARDRTSAEMAGLPEGGCSGNGQPLTPGKLPTSTSLWCLLWSRPDRPSLRQSPSCPRPRMKLSAPDLSSTERCLPRSWARALALPEAQEPCSARGTKGFACFSRGETMRIWEPSARVYTFTVPGPKWKSWVIRFRQALRLHRCSMDQPAIQPASSADESSGNVYTERAGTWPRGSPEPSPGTRLSRRSRRESPRASENKAASAVC